MRKIKLMPEYNCWPLWDVGIRTGNIDPDTLSVSINLRDRLKSWSKLYASTLNQEYPPESSFSSTDEETHFEKEGIELLLMLRDELGDRFEVTYFSVKSGRVLTEDEIQDAS